MKITEKDFYKAVLIDSIFIKTSDATIQKYVELYNTTWTITIQVPDDNLKAKCIRRYNWELTNINFANEFEMIYYNYFSLFMSIIDKEKYTSDEEIRNIPASEYFNL